MKATKQLNLHSHQMMWHPSLTPYPAHISTDVIFFLIESFTKASRQRGYSVYVVDVVC